MAQGRMGYAIIPKGEAKDIMGFEEFKANLETADEFSGKPWFNSYENMYERYVEDCHKYNACEFEIVSFAYLEGERDKAFEEQILSKYPNAELFHG